MHVLDFLTEWQNIEVSVTLLKSDCTTAILKIPGAYKENICGEVSFGYSYRWVDWTVQDSSPLKNV